jgi:predicted dienelactone hydrolase
MPALYESVKTVRCYYGSGFGFNKVNSRKKSIFSFLVPGSSVMFLAAVIILLSSAGLYAGEKYDPLVLDIRAGVGTIEISVSDASRSREIPLIVYLPSAAGKAPVVLFSHGLGGTNAGNAYLGAHWARRGYAAVFLQHPGSDSGVWKDKAVTKRKEALEEAASGKNFLLRVRDVPAVIDSLEKWNKTAGHALYARLDMERIGMSGHSFGAVTAQAVSGQTFRLIGEKFTDGRIKAAVILSPSGPRSGGLSADKAFAKVKIPWLLMTGTKDVAPIGNIDLKSRLSVFKALPPGSKYELVLFNAEHFAFTGRALAASPAPRNPNHHKAIQAISTAFWDAFLLGDAGAKAWLDGNGPESVLEKNDRWQKK